MRTVTRAQTALLARESPGDPMNVAHVLVLSGAAGGLLETVRRRVAGRVEASPSLRRRVVSIPLNLGPPAWFEETVFDVEDHVRPTAVAPPWTDRELEVVLTDLLRQPFDRHRALWEVWVVEGLNDDRAAIVIKTHLAATHLVPDLVAAIEDDEPERRPPDTRAIIGPDVPSQLRLVASGIASTVLHPSLAVASTSAAVRRAVHRFNLGSPSAAATVDGGPRGVRRRAIAMANLPLVDLQRVAAASEVTVHDVLLATCAGALRHRREDRRAVGNAPVVALVPQAAWSLAPRMRPAIVPALVPLGTERRDPLARLRTVAVSAARLMTRYATVPAQELAGMPLALRMELFDDASATAVRAARGRRPPFQVTITNLPGPASRTRIGRASLVGHYPFGAVADGFGLHIGAMSVGPMVCVGLVAEQRASPGLSEVAGYLEGALEELVQAT